MIVRILVCLCLVGFTSGISAAADQWTWDGVFVGSDIGGGSLAANFEWNFGTLPAGDYDDGTVTFGAKVGHGWMVGGIYLGMEIDGQMLGGTENKDIRLDGNFTIPVLNNQNSTWGAISGAATGPCIGACDGGLVGAATGGSGSLVVVGTTGDTIEGFHSEIEAAVSLRGRVGMPVGRFLPYVTAGGSLGKIEAQYLYAEKVIVRHPDGRRGTAIQSRLLDYDDPAVGYTLGLGTEIALTENLSLQTEYSMIDFGEIDADFDGSSSSVSIASKLHQGRIGIDLRF